ncbi:hormogonium polysaccharide biosynthesis glycosyltransferase HpsE [Oscillatoria sp. CS-180]|uniref:hormogonium polysaccharide biosynthesis glycosyltransferase HpsE n=1 Tax=Oscillatoria sp. CS-180 TaxID=3021720 RepID=UPI00232FF2FE|nr:hormogonium polysaccharide biosynthesis glycosyltransferase HpsE [Oscillatoria sp. CS-180]MDB9529095.1 hormogonium polysaccharide biosynthesis glycosyltransferase HpsE [Oscillatoria sp. CS-180]
MTLANEQLDFTVAIPTYNGGDRITQVLDSLKWQLIPKDLRWEIIVVDNNSTDNTVEVIKDYQKDWPILKYALETEQGAAYARRKAVRLAKSPLIGFLDDDTIPAMTWVNEAHRFLKNHPQAGVIGSRIRGRFDGATPASFERIAPFLALTDRGDSPRIYAPEKKVLPPGAGMVVRREAWSSHLSKKLVLGGRTQKSMLTGEDLEAVLHIQQAGWEIWYNPAMCLEHQIPAHRLTRPYLISLMRGIGLSRHRTRMLSVSPLKRPQMVILYALNDIRKIIWSVLKHGKQAWTDTVTASEITLYIYSIVSPFFFLSKTFKKPQQ